MCVYEVDATANREGYKFTETKGRSLFMIIIIVLLR
jgi:hypothetical protein